MNFIQLTAISASLFVASAAIAAPAPSAGERSLSDTSATTLLAREAEGGDDRGGRGRGRGRDDAGRGGHKAFEEAPVTIAREAESGDDRGDDGEEFEIDDHA
jgi:hypothetical protein